MQRTPFVVFGLFGALLPLVFDSALKGAALLAAAALFALALYRASAAARHLVWLVAVVALLGLPVFSAALPHWRVLPGWTASLLPDANSPTPLAGRAASAAILIPSVLHGGDASAEAESRSSVASRAQASSSNAPSIAFEESHGGWVHWIPCAWAVGFIVLAVRLLMAHLLLRRAARGCVILVPRADAAADAITTAFEGAYAQLGIRQRVTLLLDEKRTIPVVWGVLQPRLLLPAEARAWSEEQLRSMLLHELAHLRRRDPLVQWLTQSACALYWFNPLVWLAAWRLHVERERACDDLVLASGVRASAYAEHLLHVATRLSPAPWTAACGLAMARKSSLEGRLIAVLSEKLNRRTVTAALATTALLLGAAAAVPIAMLRAADPAPRDGETAQAQQHATAIEPKHEDARALFQRWQANARTDGKIPGALIGQLAREVENFLAQSPKNEKAPQLAALRPRLDSTHDWEQRDAAALLDDLTAMSTMPVGWVEDRMEFRAMRDIQRGSPLPAELENAAWGKPAANGLRAAWLLEPRSEQYPLGSVLKARVLFHNAGKAPLIFETETWHQSDGHLARNAKGEEIKISATWYSGITPTATYRLAPGEYAEVGGAGLAIGAGEYAEEHSTGSVGAVLEAKEGDDVRLSSTVDASGSRWSRATDPKDPAELWKTVARERLEREAPLPTTAADREQLFRRVNLDLFGVPPTPEEIAAFTSDEAPDALAKLTERLLAKEPIEPFTGKLPTGEIRFRVLAADPKAAQAPRTANSPGRYVLGENVHLLVSQTTTDTARSNKAVIAFLSADPKVESPFKPYEIALPDGLRSYAIAWERGAGILWIAQKGLVRSCDFTNPARVQETRFEPGSIANVPEQFRDALKGVLDATSAAAQKAPNDWTKLEIAKDGTLTLNAHAVTLDQLKTENAKQNVEIHAEKDVPYAKVLEAVDALKAAGTVDFFFRGAQVGGGKYRVANRTGEYELGHGRKLYLCRPAEARQWFTVIWPAAGPWPRSRLSFYPNNREKTRGRWAVVWEPGAEVVWWADDGEVGKIRVTDPAEVIVTREGRENNFPRDFALPDEVKEQFRLLGFVIGRDKTPGQEMRIGGNTGSQESLSAETQEPWSVEGRVTDSAGKPLANVPVRLDDSYWEIATLKTDAQGKYYAEFRLELRTLADLRSVTIEPVLEGFSERDLAKAGEFNALLYGGEQPQRIDTHYVRDFQPGPISRFAEHDLLPDAPGHADFVMLPASEITGEIVTANGQPAPRLWVAAATREQRPGKGAAVQSNAADGSFRLAGIPANRQVIFTVNADGNPNETSKSAEETFERPGPYQVRIILPEGGSGHGALKVERVDEAANMRPKRTQLFDAKYAAITVQTSGKVNFVLVYVGFLSSGIEDSWSGGIGDTGAWKFQGDVHLVDVEQTRAAGHNVDKRKIAMKYTSDAPDTLYLDGKAYDLSHAAPGRIFILRENGEPVQTDRTLPLHDLKDLEMIGELAEQDLQRLRTAPDGSAAR